MGEKKKKKKPCCQNEVICLESRASSILEGREPGALTSLALWHTEPLSKPVSGATEFSPEITWQLLSLTVWSKSFQGPYFKAACPWWKPRSLPAKEFSNTLKWAHLINFYSLQAKVCMFGGWALFDVPTNSEACWWSKQHLAFQSYFQNNIISGYIVLRRQLLRVFLQIEFGVRKELCFLAVAHWGLETERTRPSFDFLYLYFLKSLKKKKTSFKNGCPGWIARSKLTKVEFNISIKTLWLG